MDVKRKLFDRLKEFYHDRDFVLGVMSYATHPEDQQAILDFMDAHADASVEDIILLSLDLCYTREGMPETIDPDAEKQHP